MVNVGVSLGGAGRHLTVDASRLWVGTNDEIDGIDPATGRITTRIPSPGQYIPIFAVSPGSVWVNDGADGTSVTRYDSATGRRVATIPVPASAFGLLYADGAVWVSKVGGGSVSRIDPAKNAVVATIPVGSPGDADTGEMVAADGAVWVADLNESMMVKIDPATNTVVDVVPDASLAQLGYGYIDVGHNTIVAALDGDASGVTRFQADGSAPAWTTPLDGALSNPIVHPDGVWVGFAGHTSDKAGLVIVLDPTSGRQVDALGIADGQVVGMQEAFGSVWLVLGQQGLVERFSPDVLTVQH
jgi:streptogramin lyase